jgi:hypothetical protein
MWMRAPDVPLVDKAQLAEFIDQLPQVDESQKRFLQTRWLGQLLWWDDRSREARVKYFRCRAIVIATGVAIPALSAVPEAWVQAGVSKAVIAGLGAIVAGLTAWEGVANYGEVWREKRRAAELLKVEAWQFFQLADKYQGKSRSDAYSLFAGEVERLIAKEVGEYVAVFAPPPSPPQKVAT